jgi:hypothetical protein
MYSGSSSSSGTTEAIARAAASFRTGCAGIWWRCAPSSRRSCRRGVSRARWCKSGSRQSLEPTRTHRSPRSARPLAIHRSLGKSLCPPDRVMLLSHKSERVGRPMRDCRVGRQPALSAATAETSAFDAMQHCPTFAGPGSQNASPVQMACLSRPSMGAGWAAVGQQRRISMLRGPRVNRHRELEPAYLQALLQWSQPGSNR